MANYELEATGEGMWRHGQEHLTRDRAHALIRREGLDLPLQRRLVDLTDELERRLAVRRAFAPTAAGDRA